MKRHIILFVILFLFHSSLGKGIAGDLVTIRFVEASNEEVGIDKGLEDIGSILKGQLPFKRYRLIDRSQCKLPAKKSIQLARGYHLKCQGKQEHLTIWVRHGKADLLHTTVALKDGKPLMLGGFPDSRGKLLLVLLAK